MNLRRSFDDSPTFRKNDFVLWNIFVICDFSWPQKFYFNRVVLISFANQRILVDVNVRVLCTRCLGINPENHHELFMYASAIDPSKSTGMKPRSQNSILLRGERYTECRRYLCCVAPFSSNIRIEFNESFHAFIHKFHE